MATSGIRLVMFDMGGVVVSRPGEYWKELELTLGLPCHCISKGLRIPEMKKLFLLAECGMGTAGDFEVQFSRQLMKSLKRAGENLLVPLISGFPAYMKPREEVVAVVDSCRLKGIATCLLTNNFLLDPQANKTVLWPDAADHFDFIVESARVKWRKPDPPIFLYAMQLADVLPEECVFLDDIQENVNGAKSLGIEAIKVEEDYTGAVDQLRERLGL